MKKNNQNIFKFFLLFGLFLMISCNSYNRSILKTFNSENEYLKRSVVELEKNFIQIDSILEYNLTDGSIFLNEIKVERLNDKLALNNTLKLLKEENITSIYIKSLELILYELASRDGFYHWSVYYLVYNPKHTNYESHLKSEIEKLVQFKRIGKTDWYRMEISRNFD